MRNPEERSSTSTPRGVPLDFADLFAAEEQHFWFRSRNQIIATVIRQLTGPLDRGYRVLEVGCGTGYVLRELARICTHGEVVGMDLFEEGLQFARLRTGCQIIQSDIYNLPWEKPYDVIGMFDVLEHLPDDRQALGVLHSRLTGAGRVVLTVPAHMHLWSYADVYAQHYRRYRPHDLHGVLRESGFCVEYLTQFMLPLFPLMWLARRFAAWRSKSEDDAMAVRQLFLKDLRIVPLVNGLLYRLLSWEKSLIARRRILPLGTSLLAIARKVDKVVAAGWPAAAA